MTATIDQVVAAANALPLSIVIVGVGNADFGNMEVLDADTAALRSSTGVVAQRDIVQFIPFNKYAGAPGKLAEDTLQEIPGQLTSYMKMRGISPNPPLTATTATTGVTTTTTTTTTTAAAPSGATPATPARVYSDAIPPVGQAV
jgi:hypothetical protein